MPRARLLELSSKKLGAKQPLQDITDRYKTLASPTPKSKPSSVRRPVLSSSLPPSSPPSASSGPLIDHHVHPMSPSAPDNLEFDEPGLDIAAGALDANSDPFGFFALENKLKIFRSHHQIKPRLQTAHPPEVQTTYNDLPTPPTPSKRRNKRKSIRSPIPSSKDDFERDSIPSTPVKPISRKGKERVVAEDKSIPEDESDNDSLTSSLTTNPRRRTNVKGVSIAKEPENPSQRYSLRRIGAVAKPSQEVGRRRTRNEGGYASVVETAVKPTRPKPRVKRTTKPTTDANPDVGKWEQERQARLDYFKKLEGYQLEKENVYVN